MRSDCEFERIGLLKHDHFQNQNKGMRFAKKSPQHAIEHNAIVKVI
jgi:hypothetical protein